MPLPDIKTKWIRGNAWCKDLRKTGNPEALSELIRRRIESPNTIGPFLALNAKEEGTDIITAFIQDEEGCRERIEPAIGLLLYKIKHGKIQHNNILLRGIFDLIRESKLTGCHQLLHNWLQEKYDWLTLTDGHERLTYRTGMLAFACIQNKGDVTIEHYWHNIWREGESYWWPSSFLGLRIQNPKVASKELPLLMTRKTDKLQILLEGMWRDENARSYLEDEIKKGLKSNTGWAGLLLNNLLGKLSADDKNELMSHLNGQNVPKVLIDDI